MDKSWSIFLKRCFDHLPSVPVPKLLMAMGIKCKSRGGFPVPPPSWLSDQTPCASSEGILFPPHPSTRLPHLQRAPGHHLAFLPHVPVNKAPPQASSRLPCPQTSGVLPSRSLSIRPSESHCSATGHLAVFIPAASPPNTAFLSQWPPGALP